MRKFYVLCKKEIRELVTMQLIIPVLVMVLLFGGIGKIVGQETKKAQTKQNISIVDLDRSVSSDAIIKAILKAGFTVEAYVDESVESVIEKTKKKDANNILVIPKGFEASLSEAEPKTLDTYTILKNFSFTGSRSTLVLRGALTTINDITAAKLLANDAPQVDYQKIKNPVKVREHVIVKDKSAVTSPDQVMSFVTSQTTFIPIILMLVIIFASQLIATAIATEKENKTLETLLSTPIKRSALVTAKMMAAGLVALLIAAVYMIGFRYYMDGITGGALTGTSSAQVGKIVDELGLVLTAGDYVILGLSLFLGILCALAISIILGAFAEDVKNVQALVTPLMVLVLIPYFLVLFLDFNAVSPIVKYLVLAIPFSHPFLAAPDLLLKNYSQVFIGIGYQLLFFTVFVLIAARIFASDMLLTMKIKLGKKR